MTLKDYTQILILASIVIWIIWDIYVYKKQGNLPTESWTIWKWSYRLPAIAFAVGVLCGHFFFQMSPPEKLSVPCVEGSNGK